MNWSQRGSYMFTGSADGSLRSFDKDFICYWQTRVSDSGLSCLAFRSDSLVLVGCSSGSVVAFNLGTCTVNWSAAMHTGRVASVVATAQHSASIGPDGSLVLADIDGIVLLTLRCGSGWCGAKFCQSQSLASASCDGKLQLRSLALLPPRAAVGLDAVWQPRVEVDVETGDGQCTAFDIIDDKLNGAGGVAVLAVGQVGAECRLSWDVTAVIVDLVVKAPVLKIRGPSSVISRIAFADASWSLLPQAKHQENKVFRKQNVKNIVMQDAENKPVASGGIGGVACLSGVPAIIAACKDGTGQPQRYSVLHFP
jgi:hypothetical protein